MNPILNITSIISLVLICSLSYAQKDIVRWSTPIEIPRSEEIIHYTLVDDSIPAIVSTYGEAIIMRSFTTPQQEFPLFIRTDQDPHLEMFSLMDDKLFTLESSIANEHTILNINGYHLTSTRADKYLSIDVPNRQKLALNTSRELFFNVSKDGRHVLLCQQKAFEKQSKAAIYVVTTHDEEIELVTLPSEFDGDDVTLLGATIDNDGIVYFATETGIKLNSPFRKKYLVYSYHPSSKTLTEFDLSSSEFFILDLIVTTTDNGALISCLYSTDPLVEDKTMGYTHVRLNKDGLDINTRLAGTFGPKMAALFGEEEALQTGIKDLFLNQIITVDQEPWLVMEKRYKSRICTADPHTGIMTCTDQYHFNAVAFENIQNKSKSVTIDKRQLDYDKPSIFTKHAIAQHNSAIYMFYNDHFKNSKNSHEYVMSNTNRSVIRFAKISSNSSAIIDDLETARQTNYVFVPSYGVAQFKNYSFLLAADGKYFRVGKLDLNQLNAAN